MGCDGQYGLRVGDYLTGDVAKDHPCMPPIAGKPGESWRCECGQQWRFETIAGHQWDSWVRVASKQTD